MANVTDSQLSRAAGCCCVASSRSGAAAGFEEGTLSLSCDVVCVVEGCLSFCPTSLTVAAFSWWCICDATHHLVSWTVHWAPLAGAKVGPSSIMKCILVTAYLCQDALYNMNHAPDPPYVTHFPCVFCTEYIT
jgi:hypothetical protein